MLDSSWDHFAAIETIDWVAMLAGIIGVVLSIKERPSAWPFFILCYSAYIYIYLRSGYYASAVMDVVFVGIAVYGWGKWSGLISSDENKKRSLKISKVPDRYWPFILVFVAVCTTAVGILLSQMNNARLPYLDAFAVSNALVAQWMLSRKHLENWIFWIISDIAYIGLFLSNGTWPSVFLFSVFILLACKGWHGWKQSLLRNALSPTV